MYANGTLYNPRAFALHEDKPRDVLYRVVNKSNGKKCPGRRFVAANARLPESQFGTGANSPETPFAAFKWPPAAEAAAGAMSVWRIGRLDELVFATRAAEVSRLGLYDAQIS
ncbi:hypothetical protein EVAR_22030_1 [Eumeta japonica]|uniref:Uncharacterized protein n=1 Tax=Eumeta variegata TaxID=151549 RepID=A0A4C1USJ5_EUMVA|nr:hypothetical protein EVAR_22030_1 [Eumeta japonica]